MSKKIIFCLALLMVAGIQVTAFAAPPTGRERLRFDSGWKFHLEEVGGANGVAVTKWRWKADDRGEQAEAEFTRPDLNADSWQEAGSGDDVFHGRRGFAWFRAALNDISGPNRLLHFEHVDDNATVYLNGTKLLHHEGWDDPFDVPLDAAWKPGGPNLLVVLVQNTDGAGGITDATLLSNQGDFQRGPASATFEDGDWRSVHLPHDFVVEGTFDPKANNSHGSLPAGVGWYRKTFDLPAADKGRRLWLDFDGVYRNSMVWLNGHLLGNHKSGYTGFRYDITDVANYGGKNTLAVRADARATEGWWYEGGGIYRHVWLNKAAPLYIAPDTMFVAPDLKSNGTAEINLKFTLENHAEKATKFRVVAAIVGPNGETPSDWTDDRTIDANTTLELKDNQFVSSPKLWSLETPNLYRLVTHIYQEGREVDRVTVPFGIRTLRFDSEKGFFLNGKPVKIKGTCNHQDFAGVGIGMPDSLLEWRIKKLKEMGSNAYRCSHNPPAAELLDACDRLGMLVMDENRHLGDTYRDHSPRGTGYADLSDLKDLIRRDRNHPSVIMWSMCNEEGLQGSEEGARIFTAMKQAVLSLDSTRPVTSAMNGGWGQGDSLVEDLQGCNYNPGGYDQFHKDFPDKPVYGSETASAVSTRGEYANDPVKGYVSAYDVNAPPWAQPAEVAWKPLAERDFMMGGFVWTGFDYKGEPTPYGWPCINSHFGIMDICGFPKDTYYYYQSWWGEKPVVHLLPHWNWPDKEGKTIDVWCHSNAEKVELFLNGKSLGAKAMPRYSHLEWKVPYTPGRMEAKGYDKNGRLIAMDVVETTGAATQIRLSPDRTTLKADGEDVVMVAVSLLDEKGRVVPLADNQVTFTVTGAGQVAGVGNGDPSSHEPDKASQRKAFHGLCLAVVQAGEQTGTIELTATALGLKPAHITLRAK